MKTENLPWSCPLCSKAVFDYGKSCKQMNLNNPYNSCPNVGSSADLNINGRWYVEQARLKVEQRNVPTIGIGAISDEE